MNRAAAGRRVGAGGLALRRAPDPGARAPPGRRSRRAQLREQARNVLREQKFEQAYLDWAKDLRARAYVEMREPPQ
ncbi:MAG: hypothetical protein MZW92_17405 [Comamonadaceae bacterium]|nr:hypothetical protein [Comamonadaceae bacterium]